ncbi:hypothetical protein CVT26_010662 [Gymnopilus dilepis]|uniref:DUF4048 domain-containing protein n=1 Tax=Gymnopilus dilepis TaxID=231916 RepID=A0A409VI95_9AGAR|nr:hypothetical protein CVT26_010662 [Gymnopilus dilepis]
MSATHALSCPDNSSSRSTAAEKSPGRRSALSPSASSGPKPLHLPLASVVSPSRSPSSSSQDFNASYPSPRPSSSLYAAESEDQNAAQSSQSPNPDSNEEVEGGSSKPQPTRPNPISLNSPGGNNSADPSYPSPLSPSMSGLKKQNPRRQSSISYITSSSPSSRSPSTPQFQFNSKRASINGDLASPAHLRSPLSSVHPTFGEALEETEGWQSDLGLGGGLARSNSLGGRASRGSRSPRSPNVGEKERSSTGSIVPPQNMKHLKERPPVTLAEKHAELLHFIAQKESKCLELRSQLAVHEAELLQLKRKWERIVNRGFEKSLSPSSPPSSYNHPHPTSPPSSSIPLSASLLSTSPDSTFSPTSPNTSSAQGAGAAVVLEGIKEGVQGVSRFIAAGLESIVHVGPPTAGQSASEKADASSTQHAPPLPLKLGSVTSGGGSAPAMARNKRHSNLGHEQKASQSSSSSSSTRTSATFSSLVSAGSSSATSSASRMSTDSASGASTTRGNTEYTTGSDAPAASEAEDDFGAFESAQPQSSSHSSPSSSADDEQVLMVHDTGATPTMSPNPAFEKRRSRMDRKRVEVEKLVFSPGGSQVGKERTAEGEDFGWDDDVWGDHDQAQPPSSSSSSTKAPPVGTSSSSTTASASQRKPTSGRNARPKSPLAPMSSIPGLSMGMNMGNMSAPSAEQVSSWMGSMGKKWGEITKGGSTLVKNPKRASLLLSDMQQSIVSALGSPISISGAPQTPASARSPPSSYAPPLSSNASQTSSRTSTSLLDDSDDESFGESGLSMAKAPVMVPESLSAKSSALKTAQAANRLSMSKAGAAEKKKDEDEDEWNW